MEKITIKAEPRAVGRHQVRELRGEAKVPAVVYGQSREARPVALSAKELQRALHRAGSGLLTLEMEGEQLQVLAREVQRDPIKRHLLHVDFQAVSLTELLSVEIPVMIEGVAPVSRIGEAILVRHLEHVQVECLPGDIPGHLVADVSALNTIDDVLYARDVVLPAGVVLLTDPNEVIITVSLPRKAEEEETAAEGETEVEVVAKGKKEVEE